MKFRHPFFVCIICVTVIFLPLALTSCRAPVRDGGSESTDSLQSPADKEYNGQLFFENRRYSYTGEPSDISADGDILTLKRSGMYLLSGELSEGRISVECEGEVCLVLGGFEGSSSYGSVIERTDGGSLCLSLPEGTANVLTSVYGGSEGVLPMGCVRASGELRILGDGQLTVSAKNACGIVCSDLRIDGGELIIGCAEYGIFARNGISASGSAVTVTHARVGIYAFGGEFSEGRIEILGGRYTAVCTEVGIFAEGKLNVSGAEVDIQAPQLIKKPKTDFY
ncbi:MAG: carbohydrate-binding domain-containing protein [Clostridia bacterium]|nr:carbohydrate-binding domain-containing protein [Clostridia bacterium]